MVLGFETGWSLSTDHTACSTEGKTFSGSEPVRINMLRYGH